MPFFPRVKIQRLAGIILVAAGWVFTPPVLTGLPQQAKSAKSPKTETKFKAIWEPANVKEDIELESVHFVTRRGGLGRGRPHKHARWRYSPYG